MLNEELVTKWQPVLEHSDLPEIKNHYRKVVTAHMLEAQENALREQHGVQGVGSTSLLGESTAPTTIAGDGGISSGNVQNFDPVLISLVRRTAPNLIAFDIMGVQPMSGPTGLIFALRPTYSTDSKGVNSGANAFYGEANTGFSAGADGNLPAWASAGNDDSSSAAATDRFFNDTGGAPLDRSGMATATGEGLGSGSNDVIPSMSFKIDKTSVTAVTRSLKAEYSVELAQDLKAIHGLDAETELANILTTEINAEINREIVRKVYMGCTGVAAVDARGTANVGHDGATGVLDGRWLVERFKALVYKIETEANAIAKNTRRGKGNFIICSSDVASALSTAGVLDSTAALTVDDTGSTFAGTIGSGMKVYIDPYSYTGDDFVCVGYKGTSPYDAGMFYCPYVPLQMVRAIGEDNFQPKIGFKTRYGVGVNPFATSSGVAPYDVGKNNRYFRGFAITNLSGVA